MDLYCLRTALSFGFVPWLCAVHSNSKEIIMSNKNCQFNVVAGNSYGKKVCLYELANKKLVLLNSGELSNLTRNSEAAHFEGLSLKEAKQKVEELNSKPVGHDFDGCHLCGWSISIEKI